MINKFHNITTGDPDQDPIIARFHSHIVWNLYLQIGNADFSGMV
jgi:hypothetical protein